jgi:hypothetical protein
MGYFNSQMVQHTIRPAYEKTIKASSPEKTCHEKANYYMIIQLDKV